MERRTKNLEKKHGTRNPFQIANDLNIIVIREPLGSLNGFYNVAYRQRFIHVNESLTDGRSRFVCAHELGHAILHRKLGNTQFLHTQTLLNCDHIEREANLFAVHLLITDDDVREHQTVSRLAAAFDITESLAALRCQGYVKDMSRMK